MHRITVVTNSTSSDVLGGSKPSSPVPGLDAASDYSRGDEPSPNSPKKPVKISNWRKRGLHHIPSSDPEEPVTLDLSFSQRRDLPIKLVVDEPVPVENYYDDPYTQAFVGYFKHGSTIKKGTRKRSGYRKRDQRRAARVEEEKSSSSTISGEAEVDFANFDYFDSQDVDQIEEPPLEKSSKNNASGLIPINEEDSSALESNSHQQGLQQHEATTEMCDDTKAESPTNVAGMDEASSNANDTDKIVNDEERDELQEAEASDAGIIIRCNGPVIRMKYEGEMVSVSEQTATKIQEGVCAWV